MPIPVELVALARLAARAPVRRNVGQTAETLDPHLIRRLLLQEGELPLDIQLAHDGLLLHFAAKVAK